jgi:hypothetical protein
MSIKELADKPEQEPFGYFQLDLRMDAWVQNRDNKKGVPFYTAPPKPWIGLTDEEIAQVVGSPIDEVYLVDFRRVIEKLKERNT